MFDNDSMGLTLEEKEKIERKVAELMETRRVAGAGRRVALTDRELKVMANMAEVLARDRVNKTTASRTIKIHLHEGNPVEFEVVHERHEKRKLS
jgi:hypothetical protein